MLPAPHRATDSGTLADNPAGTPAELASLADHPVWRGGRLLARGLVLLGLTWGFAALCNLLLEVLQDSGPSFVHERTLATFALDSTLIWLVGLLLLAVVGRAVPAYGLLLPLALALGYANRIKLQMRHEPLFLSDLHANLSAGGLVGEAVSRRVVVAFAVLVLGSLAVVVLVTRVLHRRRRATSAERRRMPLLHRLAAAALSLAVLATAGHFNARDNPVRRVYEASGATWSSFDQALNYQRNGMVAGLLYNTDVPAMHRPRGYTREAMVTVARRYAAQADARNVGRSPDALRKVNVVMVLSESLTDPTRLSGLGLDGDPIPFLRRLMRSSISGTTVSPVFAGGTANAEFEALTGMSLSLLGSTEVVPFQMLVPQLPSVPSAAGLMRSQGHRTVAVHAYDRRIYRRADVYPRLGFDRMVFEESMQSRKRERGTNWISDRASFAEVEHQIRSSAAPVFVNLVTMQNHTPWETGWDGPVHALDLDAASRPSVEAYLRGLRLTDDALRGFVQRLARSPEPTVVVMYGDHQPGVWPASVQEANGDLRMHETPFVIWSNRDDLRPRRVGWVSPTRFMPLVLDALDAPVPPYYALLDSVAVGAPTIEGDLVLNQTGEAVGSDRVSPRARQLLRDYQLVQYDLTLGRRYVQRSMFYPPEPPPGSSVSAAR